MGGVSQALVVVENSKYTFKQQGTVTVVEAHCYVQKIVDRG